MKRRIKVPGQEPSEPYTTPDKEAVAGACEFAEKPKPRGIVRRTSLPLVPDQPGDVTTVRAGLDPGDWADLLTSIFTPVSDLPAVRTEDGEYVLDQPGFVQALDFVSMSNPRHRHAARLSRIVDTVDTVVDEKQNEAHNEYQTHQLENFSIRNLETIAMDLGNPRPVMRTGLTDHVYKERLIQWIIDAQSGSQF